VSNCNAVNDRLQFIKELQKYIPISIYGNCGELKCKNNCREIIKQYKFYFAFENSNCRDYITEKFWKNALG
jgi:glycoprotein 3-alpha-L-fucosyltransferase